MRHNYWWRHGRMDVCTTSSTNFNQRVEIRVLESPEIGIVGVGEGGLINLIAALNQLNIPTSEFMRETGAAFKWGFCYEGWRTGQKDDEFYHWFTYHRIAPFNDEFASFNPKVAALIAKEIPIELTVLGYNAVKARISQLQASKLVVDKTAGIGSSFHFDSHKVAEFLKDKATQRGIIHTACKVKDVQLDENGNAKTIQTDVGDFATDLLIDATGFARMVVGKKLNSKWHSFKKYLWLDKAIPFHLSHQGKNPELVTRATAMKAGWMWQIPLVERIGAGYVFSSEFSTEQQALDEIEQYFGYEVQPHKTLSFEPGHFEQVWQGNIMAVGLASGFVEPLEATSIGQMLEQVSMFCKVITNSGWLVSDLSIQQFNQANAAAWQEIRDFLRMHYDCPRRDTPFWQKVAETPYPESYAALKAVFAQRTPRHQDVKGYAMHGWQTIFHPINWMFVAQPLGLLSAEGCKQDLGLLPQDKIEDIRHYMQNLALAEIPSHLKAKTA